MVRVNLGGQLSLVEILGSEGSTARIEQSLTKQREQLLTTTSDSKPLLTTITDGILHDQGAILIVSSALATSIVIIAGAKAAAEIITACRKK
jgi:hypothetical protein